MERLQDSQRKYFIDWLRVGAVALLVPFHTGMIYCGWGFHLMSENTSDALKVQNMFLNLWHMPLFFFLSGIGSYYAMGFRSGGEYAKERFLRLFVPLIFGIFIICPPQLYYERLSKGQFSGSFIEFLPRFISLPYPEGNFSWQHLWFLLYLFLMSMIALPLFRYFRTGDGVEKLEKITSQFSGRWTIYLPWIPLVLIQLIARQGWPNGDQNLIFDMDNFTQHMIVFVYGFMFCSQEKFWKRAEDTRNLSLVVAVITFVVVVIVNFTVKNGYFDRYIFAGAGWLVIRTISTWTWLLAILGFGKRYLNRSNGIRKYVVEAALPFYIIHQTVIITIGYYVLHTGWSVGVQYFFVVVTSFIGTLAIYDIAVKRWNPVRFIFGMRNK